MPKAKHPPIDGLDEFEDHMRCELLANPRWTAMAVMPRHKRTTWRTVVRHFEAQGRVWNSPSGMTAQIVIAWCKFKKLNFTMTYNADMNYFEIKAS